jgi:hypothetical protein
MSSKHFNAVHCCEKGFTVVSYRLKRAHCARGLHSPVICSPGLDHVYQFTSHANCFKRLIFLNRNRFRKFTTTALKLNNHLFLRTPYYKFLGSCFPSSLIGTASCQLESLKNFIPNSNPRSLHVEAEAWGCQARVTKRSE